MVNKYISVRLIYSTNKTNIIKAIRDHFRYKKWKDTSDPKNINNCMINNEHKLSFASFDENCTQTRIFSNTPFKWRGNHYLVHGTTNRFTSVFMHLTCLSMLSLYFQGSEFQHDIFTETNVYIIF